MLDKMTKKSNIMKNGAKKDLQKENETAVKHGKELTEKDLEKVAGGVRRVVKI
jgi:bacteriocin-like protein